MGLVLAEITGEFIFFWFWQNVTTDHLTRSDLKANDMNSYLWQNVHQQIICIHLHWVKFTQN